MQIIQQYIRENGLEDRVILRGNHCFSDCAKGPILEVDGILYEKVDEDNVISILRNAMMLNG